MYSGSSSHHIVGGTVETGNKHSTSLDWSAQSL
ncbi:hypothetical protein LINGRAHAP2_LOCUS24003 [Linum grandiflorum]